MSHPLHKPAHKAVKQYVRKHCSPLHNLFEALDLDPNVIEPIAPTHCQPNYVPFLTMLVPASKPLALEEVIKHHHTHISIYCDSSGFEEGIGASVVMYTNLVKTKHLVYYLGPASSHTVYEGEIVGLILALHLLTSLCTTLDSYTVIGTDSQATILALNNQKLHPAHHWTPGHVNFPLNERADELAKLAAQCYNMSFSILSPFHTMCSIT